MDGSRFDALTRYLARARSRRGLSRLLGGLALRGSLALLGLSATAAKKKSHKKKPCPPCKKRKKGKCKGMLPDGTACAGGTCQGGSCIVPACGTGGLCRVFLSSVLYTGNLGGLLGADAKCQALAAAAGLPGAYKAWLSDSTSSVISRFAPSPGPYQLVNGTVIASNWADLTDGNLAAPINVTETGGGPGGSTTAWTHTAFDGNPAIGTNHCQDWSNPAAPSSEVGSVNETGTNWTLIASTSCNTPLHLYCFQQS